MLIISDFPASGESLSPQPRENLITDDRDTKGGLSHIFPCGHGPRGVGYRYMEVVRQCVS